MPITALKTTFSHYNDTDVVMLLIANYPYMFNMNVGVNLYCLFGPSECEKKTYVINEIAVEVGFEKCKGFSFFHAFTRCDTVSSFFKHRKATFLKYWLQSDNQH